MNAKKYIFTSIICLTAILSTTAQNGFVKVASMNFEWVEENCWENRIAFKQNGKYGFCDSTGTVKITAQYTNYNSFTNGYAKVTLDGSNYFYITQKGEPILNKNKEQVTPIGKDGFYLISDKKIKFYDKTFTEKGELLVKQLYSGDYSEGLFPVLSSDNLWGFANLSPKIIIPCSFKSITPFKDGLAVVSKGETNENKRGIINVNGEEVIPLEYHLIFRMQNYFILEKNQQLTAYDIANKKMVTEPLEMRYYNYMNLFSKNFKIAKNAKGELALFNNQLKQDCVIAYDDCRLADDENGMVAVKKNGLWGLIDHTGNEIAACEYDDISTLQNGLIKVTKKQINGFLDKTGKMVIPLQFTRSGSFYTKFIATKYKNENILIRPKTTAELKKEELLISQKKLPAADECFDMALTDAGLKEKTQTTTTTTNSNSENTNSKKKVLNEQISNYVKYSDWYNEKFDNFIKELTACMKAPITKKCTNDHWRHTYDANYAWTGITKYLKRMKSELNEIKKINYGYLCSNNSNSITKKIEANIKEINVLLDGYEIEITSDMNYLQSSSIEGADFTIYANELKSFNEFKFKKIMPHLLTIAASDETLLKLFAGCK